MSKRTIRQITVVHLALLLFFSSVLPAAAGDLEGLFTEKDEETSFLTVQPKVFNQSSEESITLSYEGVEENLVLYLLNSEEENLGKVTDVMNEEEESFLFEWDFSIKNDTEEEVIHLEDDVYHLALIDESSENEDNVVEKTAFVHNSEQPAIEWNEVYSEDKVTLEDNILEGTVQSSLISMGLDTSTLDFSFELEKDGDVYEESHLDLAQDGSFLLEDSFKIGTTTATFFVRDLAGNEYKEELVFELREEEEDVEEDGKEEESTETSDEQVESEDASNETNEDSNEETASEDKESNSSESTSDKDEEKNEENQSDENVENEDASNETNEASNEETASEDKESDSSESTSDKDEEKNEENQSDENVENEDASNETNEASNEETASEDKESNSSESTSDKDEEKNEENQSDEKVENVDASNETNEASNEETLSEDKESDSSESTSDKDEEKNEQRQSDEKVESEEDSNETNEASNEETAFEDKKNDSSESTSDKDEEKNEQRQSDEKVESEEDSNETNEASNEETAFEDKKNDSSESTSDKDEEKNQEVQSDESFQSFSMTTATPTLTDSETVELKENLTELGFGSFPSDPSTTYGPVTMGVVEEFQASHNLPITGLADTQTLNTIDSALNNDFYDGASGDYIRDLKLDLTNLGFGNFPSSPSDRYGPVTMGVVEDFQRAYSLPVTGIADSETLAAIDAALASAFFDGAAGDHVTDLKIDLTNLGFGNFPSSPSNRYGPVTMGVVEDFQRAYSLPVTGIADSETLAAIDAALASAFFNGAAGDHVTDLKIDLTNLGFGNFPSSPSNRYGPVTMGVVEDFQRDFGLNVTGIANSETLAAIDAALASAFFDGAAGDHITDLKIDLTNLGFGNFPSNPSNRFGPVTMGVVEDFQREYGLNVTGIPDSNSLATIEQALTTAFFDGASGSHITQLKMDLTHLGFGSFPTNPSNRYGPVTMGVVEDFQQYYGLDISGIADEETLSFIDSTLNSPYTNGERGSHIVELKENLTALGYGNFPTNPSNSYSSVTAGVVSEFQRSNELVDNGIADGPTLAMISSLLEETAQTGVITASSLNVRSGPSTSYGVVGQLTNGSVVSILSESSNGWYRISFNGGTAYVSGSFVDIPSEDSSDEDFVGSAVIGYVNGPSLNVRSGPGTSYGQVDSLSRDDRVEILSTYSRSGQNSWHQIKYDNNKTGYVSAGYIQLASKSSASSGPLAGKTIVLDAGHGAQDSGGIGGGMLEKDVVLDISLRAEELLRQAGAEVIMIRRTDFFLSLSQRSFIGNRSGADAFVSVHTNVFNGSANGTETFWHGKYERANSIRLAHALQDATVAKMGTHYRRVEEGNYHVIRETQIPSALLEVAFKDYPADAAKLRQDSYRQRSAEAIRDAMINYFR
ncbi:peptidoglycan-binding protein [Salipaludibacillus keqinensis]|uniref:peptidoglycan-binding protein n=1 Tax=Salipaludibacillus keqinensis TaxID=2045207 RepID=UPI0013048741|nr:peptidoglycan-binding protein [Salipaludibacillus keqinensis]